MTRVTREALLRWLLLTFALGCQASDRAATPLPAAVEMTVTDGGGLGQAGVGPDGGGHAPDDAASAAAGPVVREIAGLDACIAKTMMGGPAWTHDSGLILEVAADTSLEDAAKIVESNGHTVTH